MRTRIYNEHWKWIVWLFILILLNAIALAAGRYERRGERDSSSSGSKSESARPQPSAQPAVAREPSAPVQESRSVVRSESRPQRTEAATSVSPSNTPWVEVRSPSGSIRGSRVDSSQAQPQIVERSRPVRHEVIVAPSSQSLNVSSPQAVVQTSPSNTVEKSTQVGRNRTVEVKQVQSEQGGNSVSPTSSPLRRDSMTETSHVTVDNSKTPLSQGSLSDSNRQPGNRVDSSQVQPQIVERSRPVRHEVIVAPSSQSLNVSSPQAVVQTSPSNTVEKSTQVKRDRTVEVKQVQSEQGGNSVSPTSSPLRRDRVTETTGIVADNTKTKPQQDSRSDSNRQARGRVEITNPPQSKESKSSTITSSSVTAADTGKSQETAVSSASQPKSDRSKTQIHSDNSVNTRNGTVIRHEGRRSEDRKIEPVVVKTEDIKVQPQKSRPSQSDGQRPDNNDHAIKTPSRDRTQTPSVIASRTDDQARIQRNNDSESLGRQSDSRWSKLRSKINDEAGRDMLTRDGRSDRQDRIQSDEQRGRVVINNNNNIIVENQDRHDHGRPIVSRHLFSDIGHIRNDYRWVSCGSSFSFRWSDSSCGRVILSPYHNHYGISYYYPSYHRKYLFVSLGGYWPYSYRYQRYYWYGCHPYYWYGSDVVLSPSPVVYDYTTYNYYTTPAAVTTTEAAVATDLAEDAAATDTPLPQTQADINFAGAVNAFEEGRYDNAVELFREALLQSPEDEIMPFTYTQALFASGNYALAAYVLRETMAKMPSDEPAIYFPRGLYKDDQILLGQIAQLESAIVIEPFSTDYQLLLGYQYLGTAQWDRAVNALEQAARNPLNTGVVTKLLDIAEKMEKDVQPTVTAPQS